MPSYLSRSLLADSQADDQRLQTQQASRDVIQARAEAEATPPPPETPPVDWGGITRGLLAQWGGPQDDQSAQPDTSAPGMAGASRLSQPSADTQPTVQASSSALDWGGLTRQLQGVFGQPLIGIPLAPPAPPAPSGVAMPGASRQPALTSGPPLATSEGRQAAPAAAVSTPAAGPAGTSVAIDNSSRASFARTAYPAALSAAGGDPELAKRLIASAISENGTVGGGGDIGVGFNFGGIKYDPQSSGSGNYGTWESEGGQRVNQNAGFAHYDSPEAGFAAIPRFIQTNFPKQWAQYQADHNAAALYKAINVGGYATDPQWSSTIEGIAAQQVAPAIAGASTGPPPTPGEPGGPPLAATYRPLPTATAPSRQQALTSGPTPSQGQFSPGSYTPNQISAATSEGLDYETALAVCGPAAAIAFARKTGRNPTMQEAVGLARQVGWTSAQGMAGPASEQKLLGSMGVASRLVDGVPDWGAVAADVQNGNPVIISTPGHYFVAEQFDPASGKFNFGNSTAILKAAHGQTWFTPEEMASLGMGAPRGSLFMDSPATPAPSVVAGASNTAATSSTAGGPAWEQNQTSTATAQTLPAQPAATSTSTSAPDLMMRQPQALSYKQPLIPTSGPDTFPADASSGGMDASAPAPASASSGAGAWPAPSFQDDQSQSGWVQPDMAPGPPVPAAPPSPPAPPAPPTGSGWFPGASNLTQAVSGAVQPVTDAVSNIPGAITSGLSSAGSALQGANTTASNAVDAAQRAISYNTPQDIKRAIGFAVGPEAGIVGAAKASQRAQQIDQQAADWLLAQGKISPQRATLAIGSANDPAWRAANPDLAQEYDDLQSQLTLTVGGMAGAGGEHPAPEGAPRPAGEPAAAARPETSIAPDVTARPPEAPTAPAPAPAAASAVENAHAALDTLEAQGVDVGAARSALPERPATPDVASGPSVVPDATPDVTTPAPAAEPGHIPGMGYYDPSGTSPEAADLVRQERARYEQNDLRTLPRAEVVAQAGRILEQDPETVARWQREVAESDRAAPVVKGQVLQESAYGDAHAAVEATQRFNDAQAELKAHIESGGKAEDAPPELKQRLAEATTDLASLKAQIQTSATAHTAYGTAAARIMNQRKSGVSARSAFQLAQQGKQLAIEARAAAEAAGSAARKGAVDSGTAGKLRAARDRLAESVSEKGQSRAADVEDRLAAVEQQAENARQRARSGRGAQTQRPARPDAERPPTAVETIEERLGRLKREHGAAEDAGDTQAATSKQADIDATLAEMRARAAEEAQKTVNQTKKPLTPEEAQRAVDRAIGRRASSRINKEARDAASGRAQGEFLSRFDQSLGKKIDAAIAKDNTLQAQAQVGDLAKTARDWHQRSLSDPANEAFRREEATALAKLDDHSTLGKATADDLRQRFEANRSEGAFKFRSDMEQRIADAEKQRTAETAKQSLKDLRTEARTWLDRAIKEPDNPHLEEQFQQAAENLARHSQQGGEHAMSLIGKLADAKDEASFKFHAGMEQRVADQARKDAAATQREVEASRIRGVVSQIDEVLKNPHAPGMAERLQQLHADLAEVSQKGFEKSSDLRRRLNERNLLKAGMEKGADLDALVKALSKVDANDPASIRPVLAAIQRPTTMGILREMQYVNMLSSPITNAINASSAGATIGARLLANNPLEFIGSRGTSSGTGAAFEGAAHGLSRGVELAKTVMKTGVNPDAVERAIETGSVGNVNRELLTEKFGKLGAALHAVSTRPLEAMDAMMGHIVYSSVVEQEAQKLADHMLSQGAAEVKGMTRQAAADSIKAHIWDYPEIIQKAGKIQDYTLLKSHDVGEGFGGRMESMLRGAVGKRYEGNPFISAMFDIALPFFNVPLNFTKQGIERTAGVGYQPFKYAQAVSAERGATTPAEKLAARTAQGERFAKGAISAGILTTGISLALNDNLTGDGPTDPAKRAIWAENHQPHSVKIPGTNQWISYDGTPLAVPFAAVAGAMDEYTNAQQAPGNQQLSAGDTAGNAALGAYKGTVKGVLSQSFLQGIQDQYNALANPSFAGISRSIAGTASRAVPLGGMVSWLARMTDDMQRDTGRAQVASDIPANVGAQLASRIPGLREQLNPRLGAYGEDTRNPQYGLQGILPYYRGSGQNQDDPLTQHLEASNVGTVLAPRSMPIPLGPGSNQSIDIPLTQDEQRAYQQIAGQEFRRLLDANQNSGTMSQAGLVQIRAAARKIAEGRVQQQIGSDEIRRRLQPGLGALQGKAS